MQLITIAVSLRAN